MKRLLFSLSFLLILCTSVMAQHQVIIKTTDGEVDTYPFSQETQIRLLNGKVEFRTPNTTKVYAPSDIEKMGFDVLIESISLNYEVYALQQGETITLEATISPDNATNTTLSWSSSNEEAVMVTQKGKVVYVGNGEAVVTATATDGSDVAASCVFTCIDGIVTIIFNDHNLKVYDAEGRHFPELKPGLNIIQIDEKTTKKIFVK